MNITTETLESAGFPLNKELSHSYFSYNPNLPHDAATDGLRLTLLKQYPKGTLEK